MAERAVEEGIRLEQVEQTAVITGDDNYQKFLYYQLKLSMAQAESVDIIVSFLMESGVRMLLQDLQQALSRGVRIRILTGSYLGITQPSALYLLKKELGDRIDLRFYNDPSRSFHPKAYIFHYGTAGEIFIGSSNISRSALTKGIEWNYRLLSAVDEDNFRAFQHTFEDLFEHHSLRIDDQVLKEYSRQWKRPSVDKDLAKYERPEEEVQQLIQPRGAQIEALYALADTRAEGAGKALVQAATGIGKTYLAAFDSLKFKRVLFVAHREEILQQAQRSFANVRPQASSGFFNQQEKNTTAELVFASVASLGKEKYLQKKYFAPEAFDYLVIDEFHHAVNEQYLRIIEYFKPKFLLGLTATPDRLDGRSIFALCDYNVPFELSLQEAIVKGMLVPFHYYGIYDSTDYSGLSFVGGHYAEVDLNTLYLENKKRYDLIYKHYCKHPAQRALGFCCSRKHAEAMAEAFCKRGVRAAAVYSGAQGEYALERETALQQLKEGQLQVIFSVDMFNEGVDVPNVDMVLFLRPTESPIVFLQQLGRGLRKSKGKEYLTVLDFIGNYRQAGKAPWLLAGSKGSNPGHALAHGEITYPEGCLVDFDMDVIDLFQEMDRHKQTVAAKLNEEFARIQGLLGGKTPTRMELFNYMDGDIYQQCIQHSKENIFKDYLGYKEKQGLLTANEEALNNGLGREFLHLLETTNMVKVYKMPILMAFYNGGQVRMAVTEEELLASWLEFFNKGTNWRDLKPQGTREEYLQITPKAHLQNILKNPVNFLKKSGQGFFIGLEGFPIALNPDLANVIDNPAFIEEMKDIIDYRTADYYQRRYLEKNRD